MSYSSALYGVLGTLLFGVLGGALLFLEWLRHRRRFPFLLTWALGFFMLFWFQIPFIEGNMGRQFTVAEFSPFYALAFPIGFLGLVLIYTGFEQAIRTFTYRKKIAVWVYAISSFVAFGLQFFFRDGVLGNYIIMFITLALHAAIGISILVDALRCVWVSKHPLAISGSLCLLVGGFFAGLQDTLVFHRALQYPPSLWFPALMSYQPLFIVQLISVITLLTGALLMHRVFTGEPEPTI